MVLGFSSLKKVLGFVSFQQIHALCGLSHQFEEDRERVTFSLGKDSFFPPWESVLFPVTCKLVIGS